MPTLAQDRGHILVVDDYQPLREIVKLILQQHAFRVSEASNGPDAITKANALKPDLILLDLAMPGVNGAEVAAILHRDLPTVPIVVLTMYEGATEKLLGNALLQHGISAVVSKSTGMNQLAECVEKLIPVTHPTPALTPQPGDSEAESPKVN